MLEMLHSRAVSLFINYFIVIQLQSNMDVVELNVC